LRADEAPVVVGRRVDQVSDDLFRDTCRERAGWPPRRSEKGEQAIGGAIDRLPEIVEKLGVDHASSS